VLLARRLDDAIGGSALVVFHVKLVERLGGQSSSPATYKSVPRASLFQNWRGRSFSLGHGLRSLERLSPAVSLVVLIDGHSLEGVRG
jgi:hypothetical protein